MFWQTACLRIGGTFRSMTTGFARADSQIDSLAVNQSEIVTSHARNASGLKTSAIRAILRICILYLLANNDNNNNIVYFEPITWPYIRDIRLRDFGHVNVDFLWLCRAAQLLLYFHRHEFRLHFNRTAPCLFSAAVFLPFLIDCLTGLSDTFNLF